MKLILQKVDNVRTYFISLTNFDIIKILIEIRINLIPCVISSFNMHYAEVKQLG